MSPPLCKACGVTACTQLESDNLQTVWQRESGYKWSWHSDLQAYWVLCLPCHRVAWPTDHRVRNRFSQPGWLYRSSRGSKGRVKLVSGVFFCLTDQSFSSKRLTKGAGQRSSGGNQGTWSIVSSVALSRRRMGRTTPPLKYQALFFCCSARRPKEGIRRKGYLRVPCRQLRPGTVKCPRPSPKPSETDSSATPLWKETAARERSLDSVEHLAGSASEDDNNCCGAHEPMSP